MRSFVIILLLFFAIITIAVFYLLSVIQRLKITFDLFSIELKTLNIGAFALGKGFIRIGSKICIDNPNALTIKFSSLYYEIFYENELIVKSSDINENLNKVNFLANKTTCFITKSDVFVNPKSISLLYKIKSGEKAELQYTVYFKLFFINLSKKGIISI